MDLGFDPKEWADVEPREVGDYENLEVGGHEVKIIDARVYENPETKNKSLRVCVDIAGNDKQAGFFKKQYDNDTRNPKKWANGGTRYMSLKKESLGYLKGFTTALENSNSGFTFDVNKDWNQLKGLKCVGVFGLEEYLNSNNEVRTSIRLQNFRSLDKLPEIKIPRVKLLNGDYEEYEAYKNKNTNTNVKNDLEPFGDMVEISDDFLD